MVTHFVSRTVTRHFLRHFWLYTAIGACVYFGIVIATFMGAL